MLKKKSKIVLYISPLIVSVIIILLVFEVKVHQSFNTYFEVNPIQKWLLTKGVEGQIVSKIIDFESSVSKDYSVVQFERGESMNFKMDYSIMSKSSVVKGDTIGIIQSSKLQERLAELEGTILITQSDLAAKSTGEKSELIDEATNRVKFGDAKIIEKKRLYERAEELFNKEYISKEEQENALWNFKQAVIENEINKAQLQALMTGRKSEELQILKSAITSYNKEAQLLRKRLKDFVITAPIHGEIIKRFSQDTLLTVNNTSQLILTAPLRYENKYYLTEGDSVSILIKSSSEEIRGKLVSISKEVRNLNSAQVLYVNILVDSSYTELIPGLLIQGEIILPKVTIKEFLFSLFKN
jgi:hypothetical protein